jgi:hypothetical protein
MCCKNYLYVFLDMYLYKHFFFFFFFFSQSCITTLTSMLIYQVEHEAILKKREQPGSSITWNEYKSMSFTLQVCSITST